jgi:hypothetical protein
VSHILIIIVKVIIVNWKTEFNCAELIVNVILLSVTFTYCYRECSYVEFGVLSVIMLSFVMLSIGVLSVTISYCYSECKYVEIGMLSVIESS